MADGSVYTSVYNFIKFGEHLIIKSLEKPCSKKQVCFLALNIEGFNFFKENFKTTPGAQVASGPQAVFGNHWSSEG